MRSPMIVLKIHWLVNLGSFYETIYKHKQDANSQKLKACKSSIMIEHKYHIPQYSRDVLNTEERSVTNIKLKELNTEYFKPSCVIIK